MMVTDKILYNYAIRVLARGEKTVLQIKTKLTQKYTTLKQASAPEKPEKIDAIIQKLIEAGYLSEQRFVEAFARTKINQKIGPVKILYELRHHALTDSQIQGYLATCEAWQEVDWVAQAVDVLNKKFSENLSVIWPKKAKYLESKGYTLDQIKQALKYES